MSHYYAAVWLDHAQASVFLFSPEDVEKHTAHSSSPKPHVHHKRGSVGPGHLGEDKAYFQHVVDLLRGAQEILVVGPGSAKLELIKFIHKHQHDLDAKVVGVETVDHPSDGQILAYARKYFVARDRMVG